MGGRYLHTSLRVSQAFLPEISHWAQMLEEARLRKTQIGAAPNDHVVLDRYVKQPSSGHELLGDNTIIDGRRWIS